MKAISKLHNPRMLQGLEPNKEYPVESSLIDLTTGETKYVVIRNESGILREYASTGFTLIDDFEDQEDFA